MKKTVSEIHKDLASGTTTAEKLLEESFSVIDEKAKKLNIFISLTHEEAKERAKAVDKKIKAGEKISMIAGVPSALKDNFNYKGYRTTASSKILDDYVSPYNATVVQKMLDNDAIIVGKTNMDAFAHGSSTETSDYGPTLNPLDPSRLPGGSSGGSVAAVAAGIVPYAIGSETAGSVRGPASWCGLYGFAGTFGRISRYGIVAMGSSLDRAGVLANSTMDCAIVSDIISGMDGKDATAIQEGPTSLASHLSDDYVKGVRLGIPKQFLDDRIDKEVAKINMEAIKRLEKLGAKIIDIDLLDPKYAIAVYTIICRSEVSSNLARIDGIRYGHDSMEKALSVIDHLALNRGEGFGNEAMQRSMTGAYALSAGYYDEYYIKASKVRTIIINDFKKAFENVDLIVGSTMLNVAPKVGVSKNNPLFGELVDMLTEPSALCGLPCMSIPVGLNSEGLPVGMQIIGPQFKEQNVLNLAYTYERKAK